MVVRIHKVTLRVTNGISSRTEHQSVLIRLPAEVGIRRVRFVDDQRLLLSYMDGGTIPRFPDSWLLSLTLKGNSCLAIIPYRHSTTADNFPSYVDVEKRRKRSTSKADGVLDLSKRQDLEQYSRQSWSRKGSWTPSALDLSGTDGSRSVCAFSKDRIHYRVYGLDVVEVEKDRTRTSNGRVNDQVEDAEMAM